MTVMIPSFETKLTDLRLRANNALIFGFVYYSLLTTFAFKTSVVNGSCSLLHLNLPFIFSSLLALFHPFYSLKLLPLLRCLFKILYTVWPPVSPAERARGLTLSPLLHALRMNISPTFNLTKSQVIAFFHGIETDATHLIRFKSHLLHLLLGWFFL